MTEQERLDIIDCLQHQHSLLGVDKERIKELIKAVKSIKCETPLTEAQSLSIHELCNKCCDILGYEITDRNNESRYPVMVEKRRAIYYFVFIVNHRNTYVFNDLRYVFGKDRTSIRHHVMKAESLLAMEDELFKSYYNKLISYSFQGVEKESLKVA